jgi:hypothetical protein
MPMPFDSMLVPPNWLIDLYRLIKQNTSQTYFETARPRLNIKHVNQFVDLKITCIKPLRHIYAKQSTFDPGFNPQHVVACWKQVIKTIEG